MTKRLLLLVFLLLATAGVASAANVTISGTVTDANGRVYALGAGSAVLTPSNVGWTISGAPVNQTTFPFTLNSSGAFSISIPSSAAYDQQPSNPQYIFRFCSTTFPVPPYTTSQSCFSLSALTLTTTQSITTQITSAVLALPQIPGSNVTGGGGGGSGTVSAVSCVSGCTVATPTTTPAITVTVTGGVSSFSGDGTILSNSASTGAVTATLANTPTGSGSVVLATSPTLVTPALGTPSAVVLTNGTGYLWNALANPTGNLALTMGSNSSIFSTTSAVSQFFAWKNTTAAVVGTSQASPLNSLCGTAFHGSASVEDCLTLQDTPGNGNDAAITFAIGHSGTSTGAVTTTFPGPMQAGAGAGPGTLNLPGLGTGTCGVVANAIGICGPASASFTNYDIQFPSTAPSGTQYLGCGTPSSNVSTCTWATVSGASSLDQLTGAAAQATGTETSAGHNYTFAGVETTALVAPFVLQDTNSSNSNTSIGHISNCAGTSIGCIGFVSNTVSGTAAGGGDIFRGYAGSTVSNGTLTGGTLEVELLANGEGLFGASAPNPTVGTSGGYVGTEGSAFTGTSTNYGMYNDSTLHCPDIIAQTNNLGCAVGEASILSANVIPKASGTTSKIAASSVSDNGTTVSTAEPLQAAGLINVTTPVRDETRFVLVSNMTAVATAGVNIGSTGASNATFSWPVTAANWYDLQCKLPVTFATTATIKFQLVSISGSVTVSNVNADTMGNTGAAGVFQDLATVAGTTLATSVTPVTGAPGASEQINYSSQFLTSHAGNIGLEFIANGTNNVTMLLGGECGITQIN